LTTANPNVSVETPPDEARRARRDVAVLLLGIVGWGLIISALWPYAFSFQDEVGYVGETRLLLTGRIFPGLHDPGVWQATPTGAVDRYPILGSLLMLPFFAVTPRAVFALGMLSAMLLCWSASSVLRSWGTRRAWALLLLAYPTIVIVSRTAMVDIELCLFMLWMWQALRRGRLALAALAAIALCLLKPTGFLIGCLLLGGELWRSWPQLRAGDASARRALLGAGMGLAGGLAAVLLSNKISTRHFWFAYDHSYLGVPAFWPTHFLTTAPSHMRTLLLFPPLLVVGVIPYIRRRELGVVTLTLGFAALMCFYFFVDFGTTALESFVLAPRLLLPSVVFLLIGYAHLLDRATASRPQLGAVLRGALLAGALASGLSISLRHQRWQSPMHLALEGATRAAAERGVPELAFYWQATKIGLLYDGPTRVVSAKDVQAPVVLCAAGSASYRTPLEGRAFSCDTPGYRVYQQSGTFSVLVKDEPAARAP
jgi:hypothetical protein